MSGTDRTVMTAGPLLDIVDDEWRADTLPEDDIQLPPGVNPPTDEAEETNQAEQDAPEKWTELGLHTIAQ